MIERWERRDRKYRAKRYAMPVKGLRYVRTVMAVTAAKAQKEGARA